jgi:RNA polymerase sigma-70 factor (ECF subfamily)
MSNDDDGAPTTVGTPDVVGEEPKMAAISDSLLVERLASGDTSSFETLFNRHYDRVYGLLFRLIGNRQEAEDVAQEVFIKLYHQPFEGKREQNLSALLYRVSTNMGYNHIRGRKRRWSRNRILVPESIDKRSDPSEQAAANETREQVRTVLANLPKRQTQLLLMRQMGFSYAELAESLGVSPGSVGTLLSRAANAFREAYKKDMSGDI